MYKSFYSDTCFGDKNNWYYKIVKRNVSDFLKPYYEFKKMNDNKKLGLCLEQYCKSENPLINVKLRKNLVLNNDDKKLIEILDCVINFIKIKDNIIVYRGLDIDIFNNKNTCYVDNGYMSTSLVKEAIQFSHNKKYWYKILVPKGNFGFCPQVFTCRDIEYELILPRSSKIKFIKNKNRRGHIEIICKYVGKEI
ncbi:MAG: hypothetical protein NC300_03725 [Bacteroidales bacterium]|nr:hypothetical protein [Clostridium sp.]MCM1203229.1 hypothetical protein [Bacteroidales bacterium]